MKKLVSIAILLCAGAGFAWHFGQIHDAADAGLRTAGLERGDLESLVSGTGTLSAVGTVEVGTQVSGRVAGIHADFNDRVTSGQLLALIDTANLAATVRDAEAGLARVQAQSEQAIADRNRNRSLYERGYVSEREFLALETVVTTSQASLVSAEAGLERARTNLDYAWITSPISGTIIQRDVEAGQTVQASLQAPTLFVIAEDLEHMEILAQVDESDIGSIDEGQQVRFSVQAYPDDEFTGAVHQIRLQPITVQNVVMYTVVIDAANPQGQLLPGMTATVDFIVERAEDVLLLPNGALSFRPTQEMVDQLREQRRPRGEGPPSRGHGTADDLARDTATDSAIDIDADGATGERAVVWYLDEAGTPTPTPVRIGLSDGLKTALLDVGDLNEDTVVIVGSSTATQVAVVTRSESAREGPGGRGGRPGGPPGLF
ncbi:MAG: efflux RND transporter periplasmic adaptor subunit [Gemmatimonadetes bacterium]|nr:efflux RND transporter periplasmic adaptor subunit [Gemmatimonadota bacterium]MBT7859441.1 efflux RND transporter periplasmic adaptor subunit [Gemmatimonadota bacterium]